MKMNSDGEGRRITKFASGFLVVVLALMGGGSHAWAQQTTSTVTTPVPDSIETIYLANVNRPSEVTEILTALRNLIDPNSKIFFVPSQNAFTLRATDDQLVRARKLVKELD